MSSGYKPGKKRIIQPIQPIKKELIDFHGCQIPKECEPYLERTNVSLIIKKGFINGMKNDAEMFCNEDLFELLMNELLNEQPGASFSSCVRQTANVATLPGVIKSLAMPDAHSGYGFSIGGVAAMRLDDPNAVICPGGVGFDINCGVRLLRTNLDDKDIEPHLAELADALQKNIPSGVGTTSTQTLTEKEMNEIMNEGLEWLVKKGLAWKEDLVYCEENGRIINSDPHLVSQKARGRGRNQLGTLGSGNHYLEIQRVDEIMDKEAAKQMGISHIGQICIMIHCGSRGLGHQVCQDFVDMCVSQSNKNEVDIQLTGVPFQSDNGQKYFKAMNAAANYAFANRGMISYHVRCTFEQVFQKSPKDLDMHLVYDVCHNIAKEESHLVDGKEIKCIVHRKGATRAFAPLNPVIPDAYKPIGQPAIIGGSMGTCSYMLVGTQEGMKKSFGSTCHGAGRKISRVNAMKNISSDSVVEEMKKKGIELRITDPKLAAEEADDAYKDVKEVVETCQSAGISRIVFKLKPLIVVKG
ncbi:RtcB domain-containing protein [Entamoeba histolytica HM-1:IMSS-B]|uniref:RNA-splicing ligase RtcB homolog 1 n=6 Tax=Entamoeba histolytica TaxID=5759 RepID=RTCB1_ENTH1|nr:hypothetical protein, conserved [Entamoeba histolytica HM-1:IMSS]C4M244.1 RecName: Full=RNA-splicing ligase RtcB homolog 1; AltName: Full=3'-phosphate/5'-hydroxy nucleic acid ligase 1 [Entamoeba histolytica HM-1:IMSS]EMD48699.1 protein C22orf28 family protein [Entamoeba histolytica KU27]EMH75504.1 RtcB domain-containing protein [Entamoeba histolytica HM-1:IMSS-B]EMS17052.1 protein C22orf28 family protein [Entamoeba histolytica HM-3:IMSS]ENY63677.1 protein C22orf28 family protein, putative [|eukprot:XP_651200.1 hypothetical protein, conserved [Entamoeba histolytica HM-1:IMSS]